MEDNDLKKLFSDFDPELPSDFNFMSKLQHRMAVLIAAMAGFVMGVVLTLLYPVAAEWLQTFNFRQSAAYLPIGITAYNCIAWALMATLSGVTALNVYEIALAKLSCKK